MKKTVNVEYGWVVEVGLPRSPVPTYVCDYAKAPPGFSRAVGLGELQVAEWFTDRNMAARSAYWKLGSVRSARRVDGRIELI